ncbi:MAG: HDIG domain-containing protein [Fusobacterium perfoetens]|uniref:HD family phosphohydrolase n=1 Tax=Fusobacterium perfoetens TaxID=852 RepID=UPI0023F1BEB3|nr:HDIG domain-containing metalloprotein [Fusobacterium perfoetens]MCI6151539.1 HDIG domain-containing protein [Fusobacterium perfoetens]MDY3237197.1 HDIG domain-containing protein [Fusobacterium perfoetens]
MKKINFLGFRLRFDLEKESRDEIREYTSVEQMKDRILYLLIFLVLVVASAQFKQVLEDKNYVNGTIIKENIYAPKSIRYKDNFKRDEIIKKIIDSSAKKYIYIPEISKNYIEGIREFYDEILLVKKNKNRKFNFENFSQKYKINIPENLVNELEAQSARNIESQKKKLEIILNKIYYQGVKDGETLLSILSDSEDKEKYYGNKLNNLELKILDKFVVPNYIYDEKSTKDDIKEKVSSIKEQYVVIKAGDLVLKKGDILTPEKLKMLNAIGIHSPIENIARTIVNLLYLTAISTIFYNTLISKFKKELLNKNIYRATFLICSLLFLTFRFSDRDYLYLIPFESGFFLLQILVNSVYAFYLGIGLLIFMLPMINYDLVYTTVTLLTILFATKFLQSAKTRVQFINLGIQLSIVKVVIYFSISFLTIGVSQELILDSAKIILSGVFSGVLTLALVPYLERTFNILSSFKLLELGDLSNPLLKNLSVKTPGTFYHSMMVAAVSEAAAEAIGADPIFTRVASYYHDIGKMKRPKFYVENQEGGENPHDKISPFLSALVILAHPKDGFELAKKYQIPKEIRDIMLEHHGTTFLAYFYNKAKSLDENVREDDFRYAGPKPKTKESAIIMLADSIEAAVRSIENKTYNNIEEMIRKIVFNKIDDGQLVDADLTFKEIDTIIKVFTKTIMGIHHVRIKYPDQEKEREIEEKLEEKS